MTARRRRKSGSGPSATALIAWVAGEGAGAERGRVSDAPTVPGFRTPPARSSFTARGRGLAAGALLACGSVLAVAVHAADSALPPSAGDLPSGLVTASPDDVSGGSSATQLAVARPPSASSAGVSQTTGDNHIRSGPVVRNTPLALDSLSAPMSTGSTSTGWTSAGSVSTAPTANGSQSLPPSAPETSTAQGDTPVSHPVERRAAPLAHTPERAGSTGEQLAAPVAQESAPVGGLIARAGGEGTQPAVTMLSPLSWDGHSD